ncbi:MAG: hypothetical protein U0441_30625 [Polyangiaceae bacterium]
MKKTLVLFGAALAIAPALIGCRETTSSEFIRTGGIAALVDVTADADDHSVVHVELAVGGPFGTLVDLQSGDTLKATGGSESKDLQRVSAGVYEATFASGKAIDFSVDFERATDDDAPSNKGTLPTPFKLTKPATTDSLSRTGDELTITWDTAPGVDGDVELDGSCIFTTSKTVSGSAKSITFAKGEIKNLDDKKPESCSVEVKLSFTRDGSTDPALDPDSYFHAVQERTVTFTSNP